MLVEEPAALDFASYSNPSGSALVPWNFLFELSRPNFCPARSRLPGSALDIFTLIASFFPLGMLSCFFFSRPYPLLPLVPG